MHFTKSKIEGLTLKQQHKKSAEMLKELYFNMDDTQILQHYNDVQSWIDLFPLSIANLKTVSDRYHWHLQYADVNLKEHRLLPKVMTEDQDQGANPLPIAIYLDNIRSAHNIGSIIRTTEAMRLGTLYSTEQMATIDNKQVQDAAMGAHEWVEWHSKESLDGLPGPIIALETCVGATSLYDFIFPETFTLVLGNEEYGCSDETLQQADSIIKIPLCGRKNSLNVANAFAIVASEIHRQKSLQPLEVRHESK